MNIVLERQPSDSICTLGELFVDGVHECYTLEPIVRPPGVKLAGQTAIPPGTYEVVLFSSPHRGYIVPLLKDVPGFTYVEIHPGNTALDTRACILVGETKEKDGITNSRVAFSVLMMKIQDALSSGRPVNIRVEAATALEPMTPPHASSAGPQ